MKRKLKSSRAGSDRAIPQPHSVVDPQNKVLASNIKIIVSKSSFLANLACAFYYGIQSGTLKAVSKVFYRSASQESSWLAILGPW
jgi:hypothetical protein